MLRHNPAILNYRELHLFHSGIDSIKVLTAVFGLCSARGGGLRDCSSISFIMMTVLPFECNETASLGRWGGGGVLVGHLFLVLCKNTHMHIHTASEDMKKVHEWWT